MTTGLRFTWRWSVCCLLTFVSGVAVAIESGINGVSLRDLRTDATDRLPSFSHIPENDQHRLVK